MGRKTFASIGKALPGRLNIVLSQQKLAIDGVVLADSLEQALELAQNAPEVMIIGGRAVFEAAMALASRLYLTVIHHQFPADVFFPKVVMDEWRLIKKKIKLRDASNLYDMTFYHYERR